MTATETDPTPFPAPGASRLRLWTELIALFVGVPILMAVFFEFLQRQRLLFGLIWLLALVAWLLLTRTPGWTPRQLLRGPVLGEWRVILLYWLVTAVTCTAFVFAIAPNMFLSFVLARPELWLMVMIAYPIASALPQEIIYRTLFFERYQVLFPSATAAILVNGALFGFGHLFYDSWVTITMTAAGGAIMAWAYLRNRSTLLAWVLHALAGQLVFTAGLGQYFYSGAVG
ncbi:MAG: CPBP family intramembrane glutamic endopeptidase [Paracoccaceae bacterium]